MKPEENQSIEKELPAALISWYRFKDNTKTLFVSGGFAEFEVLYEVLEHKGVDVSKVDVSMLDTVSGKYDYIVTAGTIEKSDNPPALLECIRGILAENGRLLIGAGNRLAIRHFCGDKDYFTKHVLDGIDNYRVHRKYYEKNGGRLYSQYELKRFLDKAGYGQCRFYSVLPDLMRPQILIGDGYIPNELLDVRVFPQYNDPSTLFMEEERLYPTLFENGMFHAMANGYFIECAGKDEIEIIDQITVQGDRAYEEAMATVIVRGEKVIKRALYPEGEYKIKKLADNQKYLEEHNVPLVRAWVEDDSFVMPYEEWGIATEYFRNLLRKDKDEFIRKLGELREIIINSSEHVPYDEVDWRRFEPGWDKRKSDDPYIDKWARLAAGSDNDRKNIGVILKRGYLDMVSLNCFASDEGFKFFDQEFYLENFPANSIFIRTIDFIYRECIEMERLYPKGELLNIFDLTEHADMWRLKGEEFLSRLRNEQYLTKYHMEHRRDYKTIAENRQRMDYSHEEYERLFVDIFKNVAGRKIYLFGSGRYAEEFMKKYSDYCGIDAILDNNSERWGKNLNGIPIMEPGVLSDEEEPYKVIICIKYYRDVLKQLEEMDVRDISVFDPGLKYIQPLNLSEKQNNQCDDKPKPYHIGYVAGVFDLFHIGHVNLFRRAKEKCDYLIVGVVSDKQVMENKKTKPYMPFDERIEIVRSCRYVDMAVEIQPDRRSTQDAFEMYHFDAQFSGDDYKNDTEWINARRFLRQHGADLVFFPYTQATSTTKLKKEITDSQNK